MVADRLVSSCIIRKTCVIHRNYIQEVTSLGGRLAECPTLNKGVYFCALERTQVQIYKNSVMKLIGPAGKDNINATVVELQRSEIDHKRVVKPKVVLLSQD